MASLTPKTAVSLADKLATLDKIAGKINETAGKKIIGRIGNDAEILEKLTIKFVATPSLDLNDAVGGGFPKSRTSIVAGLSDSGKTGLLLETIGKNQAADPDFVAGWLESEKSISKKMLDMYGIDPARFFYMEVDRKDGAEGALDKVEGTLGAGVLDMFVINSLKCLVPSSELNKSMKEFSVAAQARMNSQMIKKFTSLVAEHETAFVLIQHLTTMIGTMSRDPMEISGGHAIRYASALTLDLRKQSIQESDPIERTEGMKVGVTVKKNHCVCDRFPYVKMSYFAIYNEGIEQVLTTLDKAVEQGVLTKKGSWIYWLNADGTNRHGWQGKSAYRTFMRANPEVFAELKSLVRGDFVLVDGEELAEIQAEELEIADAIEEMDAVVAGGEKKSKKKVG